MRVSSISPSYCAIARKNVQKHPKMSFLSNGETPKDEISFKSKIRWGGLLGSGVGTLAGIGAATLLTAVTGGLAAPLVAIMTGTAAGGIAGDMIDSKVNPNYEETNFEDDPSDYK